MQRFFTVMWILHVPLLAAWVIVMAVAPGACLHLSAAEQLASGVSIFTSTVQLTLGPVFGLLMAAVYASMRQDPAARRRIARALAIAFCGVVAVEHFASAPVSVDGVRPFLRPILFWSAAALGGVNLIAAIWPVPAPTQRQLSGRADTKPQYLWLLWTLQAVVFIGLGALVAFSGKGVLVAGLRGPVIHPGMSPVEATLVAWGVAWTRRLGALCMGIGALALAGLPETQVPEWRGFRAVHVTTMMVFALAALLAANAALFATWVLFVVAGPPLLFLAANLRVVKDHGTTPPEEFGDPPDGWTFMDLAAGPLIAWRVFRGKRRGTHALGVAAKGQWEPAQRDARVPEHAWFFPERHRDEKVECVARFANVTFGDDAGMDVRGAAIRIAPPGETAVDILMNTGSCGPIQNVVDFGVLVFSKWLPHRAVVNAVKKNRVGREGGISGLRRAPESFSLLHYYSQSTRYWLAVDDARWLVRYRLVPDEPGVEESGIPTIEDDLVTWQRTRRPDERRSRDYLRRELRQRIEHVPVRMKLQAQFHLPVAGDNLAWYNGMFDWPPQLHPWLDLGTLTLTTALDDAETERFCFDPSVHPPSLGVPVAVDLFDPRSPADSERRIIRRTARLRTWMYDVFGLPTFGADEGRE